MGSFPLVLIGDQVEVSISHVVYDGFLIVVILAVDLLYIQGQSSIIGKNESPIVRTISLIQLVSTNLTLFISLVWVIYKKSRLQEYLDEMSKFEMLVHPKSLRLSSRLLLAIFGSLIVLGGLNFLLDSTDGELPLKIFLYLRVYFTAAMLLMLIGLFTGMIKIISSAYDEMTSQISDSIGCQRMKNCMKAAEHLVIASESLNSAFGPQMLSIVSSFFLLLTGNLYLAMAFDEIEYRIMCLIGVIIHFTMLFHLTSSCSNNMDSASRFNSTVYRRIVNDRTGSLSQELRSCLHFVSNRSAEFTAFGFFTIDHSLLGSMIAAAASYLVILIQLGSP
ncbi:Gustatory Receptor [Nesidiocoris tenuis]|uniref:Gustatory receptor n=1 Tax=Nesidiocoris tenuis TaxID=355587 RepID=A0ABN7AXD5_9HEMI|nr:Gustatory Receptor [Nesidiocoris tenuis]